MPSNFKHVKQRIETYGTCETTLTAWSFKNRTICGPEKNGNQLETNARKAKTSDRLTKYHKKRNKKTKQTVNVLNSSKVMTVKALFITHTIRIFIYIHINSS